ncbi:MAG: cation-translocating P-type ATPase [Desulfomicrobium sp.]|uniref:heavy metal translocating P-type ATPase n=1 Tax=Hoeflea sp. TaxID=1940281 RepID=UPI0025C00805|nr:cation-translocating P-type ATPase [Hoeflea sp.]MBU4527102.1 cation-translocating P-type ATPase [Alphaproteobacteria bacterium]MBV1711085.1 cation-translocating P-type ATPase [Desulfomicrobium sp.]MBU4544105.1 cation-translocating P-type ATPase [Alphaproteobacteria bacterium]MBU4548423.1 cation-translocating P-type ATPase [Alphaproteobacteria bacterium]MBV1785634.1 cation-translocating P-type ATPase [Hoeflea sp.]
MFSMITSIYRHPTSRRKWLTIFSGAFITFALVAWYGFGLAGPWAPLMTTAAILAGYDIALRAWVALRLRHLSIELLVIVAATGAVFIDNYWESAAVTFLFMLGAWLESRTMSRTRGALKALIDAAPVTATVLRGGEPVEVAAHVVQLGETVLVKAGQLLPVDGEVIEGAAAVNEAAITGEPIPAEKTPGSRVFAGTLAENGLLYLRATGVGADTTLARIISRVEEAQEAKAPAQRMIESFGRWYTPAVFLLAIGSYLVTRDIELALTLLVVGCPGALVISTPVSVIAGIGRAARAGILIKGGEHLENAGRITALALDKTGTLTEGRPRLAEVVALAGQSREDVLLWAGIAETGSTHPLGRPIIEAARAQGPLPTAEALEEISGMGLIARHTGHQIAVGSHRLFDHLGIVFNAGTTDAIARLHGLGHTVVIVARDGEVVGLLGLADMPRASAKPMIDRLHALGVRRVVMLTGDQRPAAEAIARAVGVDEVHAEMMPDDKLDRIRSLKSEGLGIAMVGDGINDAPALAAADISIAMGAGGSDIAIETADIALMTDDLGKIAEAMEISRATLTNMRQNLVIAVLTVIGLLFGVYTGSIHMAGGMLIHQLSVLIVIANGMRLLRVPKAAKIGTARQIAEHVVA